MENLKILLFLGLWFISCKPAEPIVLDYCAMLETDQSYVDHDEKDETVRAENSRKRDEIFKENFVSMIELTKQDGFPDISTNETPQDSCRWWAVTMTLIHMAQAEPEVFFDEKTVSLFKNELQKGNVESENLAPPFRVSFMTNTFCNDLKEPIQEAMIAWGVESRINAEPKFKDCK